MRKKRDARREKNGHTTSTRTYCKHSRPLPYFYHSSMKHLLTVRLEYDHVCMCCILAGIWCENDIVLTSMQRDDVASTLIRRHFFTKCPLGYDIGERPWVERRLFRLIRLIDFLLD